jgi:hypothetical protein
MRMDQTGVRVFLIFATSALGAMACGGQLAPTEETSAEAGATAVTCDAGLCIATPPVPAYEDAATVPWPPDASTAGEDGGVVDGGVVPPDASSPPLDAATTDGASPFDAAEVDASEAALCLGGGNVFAVDGDGLYPGIPGAEMITGSQGTWTSIATLTVAPGTPEFQVDVQPTDGGSPDTWEFQAGGFPLATGTYVATGNVYAVYANLRVVNQSGCWTSPTGTFTVAEIGLDTSASRVTSLLVWFDLTCPSGGRARGCVSYGR